MIKLDIYDMIVFEADDEIGSIKQDFVETIKNNCNLVCCSNFLIDFSTPIAEIYTKLDCDRKWYIKEIWKRKDKDTYKRVYCVGEK